MQTGQSPSARTLFLAGLALLFIIPFGLLERSAEVDQRPLTPRFSHPSGYYEDDFLLTLEAPSEATIVYTLNGETPTAQSGSIYTHPLLLSRETAVVVIRARAFLPNGDTSPAVTASYFIGIESTLPLLSLTTDPENLWDPDLGIYANPLIKGDEWERAALITYVDTDRVSGFETALGIRIHGGFTRSYAKKSFRLYFKEAYGNSWLDYQLFTDSDLARFKRLVLHSGAQDSLEGQKNWSLLRNQIVAEIAFDINGYAAHSRPVLLFINGEPWGIYQLRERLNERFLATQHNIENTQILDTPELLKEQDRTEKDLTNPDRKHWDNLIKFVETHDCSQPDNYAYIQTQIDVDNFIDYNLVQIYSANVDWPHHNVNLFRPKVPGGRWQWMFWDSDSSFGLAPISQVDTNMLTHALNPELQGTLLLTKLLENADFRQRFISRAADLLNTALAPNIIIQHIDTLAAELEPNILHESGRWGNGPSWQASVSDLRHFAQQRPDFMRQHIIEKFGLAGTASLTVNEPSTQGGTVMINGHPLLHPLPHRDLGLSLPWQGIYFTGTEVSLSAVANPGYRFVGWNEVDGDASLKLKLESSQTLTPQFESIN